MSGKRLTICCAVLLILGVCILSYPLVSDFVNGLNGSYAIHQLRQAVNSRTTREQEAMRRQAEDYNRLLSNKEQPDGYEEILNISDGMMGYIEIDKIDVNLPIYHGVSEEVLSKGVGHMPETAFPIGGEGNHSVLTGHTGLPTARLFTDLTELEEGDSFRLHILGQELEYRVDQIKVVLPSEGQDLAAETGKDYCTLVTCTPYGINTHRLLVRGLRQQAVQQPEPSIGEEIAPFPWRTAVLVLGAAALCLVIIILIWKKR